MTLRIVEVDPSDPAGFEPFYEVYAAALRHGAAGEFSTVWQLDEVRVAMPDPDERTLRLGWAGWLDDPDLGPRVVTTGWMSGSTVDNTDLANVLVCCSPAERGHGHAAAMLAHVEEQARARGRDRLVGEVVLAVLGGADGTGSAELAWAGRQGFELALVDVQRRLSLPVPTELPARWPPRRRASRGLRAALVHRSGSRRPGGGLGGVERDAHDRGTDGRDRARGGDRDVGAIRAEEALLERQGRVRLGTAALAPPDDSGERELVAYTDIVVTVHESERGYQWGTLVRPDHRGHRLGLAVKVANLQLLQETQPQLTTVVTFNADVNAPMVAVNERLGFRAVQWMGELQKKI